MTQSSVRVGVAGTGDGFSTLRPCTGSARCLEVVGIADNVPAALKLAVSSRPDVLLIHDPLASRSGIQLVEDIKHARPAVGLVICTARDDEEYLFAALQAGVDAYLLSDAPPFALSAALEAVYLGERTVDPRLLSTVLRRFEKLAKQATLRGLGLSDEDLEVLRAMQRGETNKEIAKSLCWSYVTIKRRAHDIFGKLRVTRRSHAVAEARRIGIL